MKAFEVTVQYDRENAATFLFFIKKVYGKRNTYKVKAVHMECTRWIRTLANYIGDSYYEVIRLWLEDNDEIENGSILKYKEVTV